MKYGQQLSVCNMQILVTDVDIDFQIISDKDIDDVLLVLMLIRYCRCCLTCLHEWNISPVILILVFNKIIFCVIVRFWCKWNIARNIREDDVSPISSGCLHKGGQVVRWGGLKGVCSELDSNNSNYSSGLFQLIVSFCC